MPLSDLSNNYTRTPSKICCIPGCHSTEVTPSVTMYKVPSGKLNSRYGKYLDGEKWSTDFFEVILKFRNPKENNFFQRLQNGKAFICNLHFNENDIVKTNQLSWLKFGVLPKKCLPLPEGAGESLLPPKRPKLIGNILSAEQHHDCHPSSDFSMQNSISNLEKIEKQFRLSSLKDTWTIIKHSSEVQLNQALHFTFWTLEHAKYGFPKYSVLVHSDLSFNVSICCTVIPLNHEIYALNLNGSSIIDLLNCVFKLHMCNGFVEVTGPKWHPILPVPSGNNCNGESSSKIK